MRSVLVPLSIHAWLRYATIKRMLGSAPARASLLEIGAGQGAMGALLSRKFEYLGLEPDDEAFLVARDRMRRFGSGDVRHARVEELDQSRFDIVCAFEVLEHIEEDHCALARWAAHLRPGGQLIISVPAGPERFGATDEHAGHFRRYSRDGLAALARRSCLVLVEVAAYGFPAGYALEAVRNQVVKRRTHAQTLEERTAASGRWLQPGNKLAPLTLGVAAPWMVAQRPFASTSLGTGFVARMRFPGVDQ